MLKVGMCVKDKTYKTVGIIKSIDYWAETGPISPENHGTIEIVVTDPGKATGLLVGDLEHYSLYGWESNLIIMLNSIESLKSS